MHKRFLLCGAGPCQRFQGTAAGARSRAVLWRGISWSLGCGVGARGRWLAGGCQRACQPLRGTGGSAAPQGARSVRIPLRWNKVPLKSWEKCQICHLLPFPLPGSWQPTAVRRGVKGRNKPREERCSKGCAKRPDPHRISTPADNKLRLTELVSYASTYLAKSTVMELLILHI